MSVYEVGYLYNDVITTKKEDKPTLRASSFQEKYYSILVLSRLVISFLLFVLFDLDPIFLLVLFSILLTYYLHNSFRSRFNIATYFSLVSLRYIGPLFVLPFDWKYVVFIVLVFPIPRTIENACSHKFRLRGLQSIVGDFDLFRVYYYSFLAFTITTVYLLFDANSLLALVYMSFYFLCVRVFSFLIAKVSSFRN